MLTVQPKMFNNYYPAFKASEDYEEEYPELADMDQDTYESVRDDLEDQLDNFEELKESTDFIVPKPAKKILEGGAIVTTGLLGGMAAGWGAKKSLEGFYRLNKTPAVKSLKKYAVDTKVFVKDTAKTIKKNFLESNVYKTPANAISREYNNFGNTKFGKPIVEFLNSLGKAIKKAYKNMKEEYVNIKNSIKGIKKEKVEKVTVNTIGISGGCSSAVMAVKEKQEKDED